MPPSLSPIPQRKRSRVLPLLVLLLCATGSVLAWRVVRRSVQEVDVARFERQAVRLASVVQDRFGTAAQLLYGARALSVASERVSATEWAAYFRSVHGNFDSGLVGLGFVERVRRADLDAVEARIRMEGQPGFTAERTGANEFLYLVTSIEPAANNHGVLGLDLGSGTTRRMAAETAARLNTLILSRRINLDYQGREAPGFLLLLPIYRNGAQLATEAQRDTALQGWVYASIVADQLLAGLAEQAAVQLDLTVFEHERVAGKEDARLLFTSTAELAKPTAFVTEQQLQLLGRRWMLKITDKPDFLQTSNTMLPWGVLAAGLMITLFASVMTFHLLNFRVNALELAERMTASLRQAELESRRLALVASRTANAVGLSDAEGKVTWINEGFTRLFGYTPEEARGHFGPHLIKGEKTNPHLLAAVAQAAKKGHDFHGEMLCRAKDGSEIWTDFEMQPLRDETGTVTGFMSIQLDITARKQIQKELTRTEALFRFILNALPIGVSWVRYGDKPESWVNNAVLAMTGLTREEALQKDSYGRITPPEDWARQEAEAARLARGETDQYALEKRYRRGDGTVMHGLMNVQVYRGADGEILQEVATIIDLTERKQAQEELANKEAQFRFIFESVPVGLSWAIAGRDETRIVNTEHVRLTGVTPEEAQASPDIFLHRTHPDDTARQKELMQQLRRGEIDRFSIDKRYLHEGGEVVWVRLSRRVFQGTAARPSQELNALVDITAVKRAQDAATELNTQLEAAVAQARQAVQEATQANVAKGQFLAMMSHEIRTPMNGVIGMTSLLLDSKLSPEQRDYAETIRQSGDALLTIINDILDFSKIESGRLELEEMEFSLRECVEGALDLLATRASEKHLDLLYEIADGTPGTICGDPTRLRQILVNLLGNAVKFTAQGEVLLAVRPQPAPPGELELLVSVTDSGIGIPPEGLERLFQSFTQVDASTTRKFGGTGLGLVISRRLAEIMGGRMWVESEVGRGSTFSFTFRAKAVASKPRLYTGGTKASVEGRRLLAVDDNATSRRILSDLARNWGMQPHAVETPAEALALLRSGEQFDAAILDLQMPDMDGLMLAREIRQLRTKEQLPLVLLSSMGRQEDAEQLFAANLTKPIKPSQLLDALAQLFWADREALAAQAVSVHPFVQPEARHPEQILLAEDNAVNQKVAVLMLRNLGFRADVVANGLEVLEAVGRQPYDVILMDVHMPEMDGIEATRRLLQVRPAAGDRPWIIALTANAMQGDREMCLAAGMDDYISKPIKPPELLAALERARTRSKG